MEYVRFDRWSMFFLVPIHGVGIPKKKIHLDGISEFSHTSYMLCLKTYRFVYPPFRLNSVIFAKWNISSKKKPLNKNKDNTLKELNEIFLMLFWKYDHCHISTRDIVCEDRGTLIPHLKNQGILGEIVHAQLYTGSFWRPFFLLEES